MRWNVGTNATVRTAGKKGTTPCEVEARPVAQWVQRLPLRVHLRAYLYMCMQNALVYTQYIYMYMHIYMHTLCMHKLQKRLCQFHKINI